MSALSIDFAPQITVPRKEHLAEVIQLPVRRQPDAPIAAPAPRAAAQPIRLTARGKLMVRVLASLMALALSIGIGASVGMALRAPAVDTAVVVVEPGQSLWAIATAAASPGQDVRDVVAEIVSLNALSDSTVIAGQQLSIPTR